MNAFQTRLLWSAISFITGWIFGLFLMESEMKNQAIKAGVAEYTVDKTTGEVTFQYITPCKTR